jgi:hypothetical protein
MLKQLINLFIKKNGRSPNAIEMLQLKFKAAQQSGKGQVIEFPKDRITDWTKPRPTTGKGEVIDTSFKPGKDAKGNIVEESPSQRTARIKQGFSTQSKLNNWSSNQQWVKDFIGRKNAEFNSLNKADQTEVLEMFETQIKKHMPKEPKAYGGLAGMLGERTGYKTAGRVIEETIAAGPQKSGISTIDKILDVTGTGVGISTLGLPKWLLSKIFEKKIQGKVRNKLMSKHKDERMGEARQMLTAQDPYMGEDPQISWMKRASKRRTPPELSEDQKRKVAEEINAWANMLVGMDNLERTGSRVGPEGVKAYGLAGGGLAPMLGEPTYMDENHRVPLGKGKLAKYATPEGLAKLIEKLFPGTTKLGQTSKPMAPKTELKRSIAGFQERQKNKKIRETIKADEKAVAKLKKEHKEKYGKWVYTKDRSDEINKQSQALWKKVEDLENKIYKNRYLIDEVEIDGKKYKLSDKDRPPTKDELDDKYAELWDDENSPWDFGSTIRELDAELANRAEEYKYMYQQYKMGKLDPKPGEVSRGRLKLLRERADEAGMSGDQKLFSRDEVDELDVLEDHFAQVDKEEAFQFAERVKKARANKQSPWFKDSKTLTPEEELRQEFPGIDDNLIKNILADDNPQRIAEVKAALKEALKMQQKGMGPDEIINIFKKKPTKHASGGRVSLSSGGLAGMLGE